MIHSGKKKKEGGEKKKGRFDFGFLPSVPEAAQGLHALTSGPLLPLGTEGREQGPGKFPICFLSAAVVALGRSSADRSAGGVWAVSIGNHV